MKIDQKFAPLLTAVLMAAILPCLMTLVVSIANLGFGERLLAGWLRSWAVASAAALPLILILSPLVRKLVGALVAPAKEKI